MVSVEIEGGVVEENSTNNLEEGRDVLIPKEKDSADISQFHTWFS